jgi:myo-inositol 2-dehydrogenase/D-chiro-inositol 1-dehydrogenase
MTQTPSPASSLASSPASSPVSSPLGVAVIGTGTMGADHVRRLDEVISGARVAAVADPDTDRAAALTEHIDGCTVHADAEAALDAPGVEAVLIASPGPAHEATLLAALERRLPVFCEKPLTPDPESAARVMAAEERSGARLIQVGYMRRFDAEYTELKDLLDGGSLGRPLLLHCRHRNLSVHPYFTDDMLITDSVSHEIDATRWLLGQEIAAVTVVRPAPTSLAPEGLSDPQLVLLETTGGAVATVEIFATSGFGYQVQTEAVCERGTARIGEAHGLMTNTAAGWGGPIARDYLTRFRDAYDRELRAWVRAARRGGATGPSAWDGFAAAVACQAGVTAQRTGQRTAVAMMPRPAFYA